MWPTVQEAVSRHANPLRMSDCRDMPSSFGQSGLGGHDEPPIRQGRAPVRCGLFLISPALEDSTKRCETRIADDHDVVPLLAFGAYQDFAYVAQPEHAVVLALGDLVEGRRIALKIGVP